MAATERTLAESQTLVENFNRMDADAQATFSKSLYLHDKYIQKVDGTLKLDLNLAKIDIINFKVCRHMYGSYINVVNQQCNSGYKVNVWLYEHIKVAEQVEENPKAKVSFEQLFQSYCAHRTNGEVFAFSEHHADQIAQANPLVKEAYDKLGKERVEELKYKVTNIRRELVKVLDVQTIYKVVTLSDKDFDKCVAIPVNTIKAKLQKIYDDLGIKRTAKATDLGR